MNDYELEISDIISFNAEKESRLVLFNHDSIGRIESKRNNVNPWFISNPIDEEGLKRIAGKVDDKLASEVVVQQSPNGKYTLGIKYKSKYATNFIKLARLIYTEIQLQDLPF